MNRLERAHYEAILSLSSVLLFVSGELTRLHHAINAAGFRLIHRAHRVHERAEARAERRAMGW